MDPKNEMSPVLNDLSNVDLNRDSYMYNANALILSAEVVAKLGHKA